MNKLFMILLSLSPLVIMTALHWLSGRDFVRSPDLAMTLFFGLVISLGLFAFLHVNDAFKEPNNDSSR
jgi:hypothetical protein